MSWPWSELGLSGPSDLTAVRHAYAECLKTTHPEEDPEGFQRLNEAYQQARKLARRGGQKAGRTTPPTAPKARTAPPKPPKPNPPEEKGSAALDELFRTPPPKPEAPPEETPRPTEKGSAALDELFRTPPPKPEAPTEETPRPTEKGSAALDELFRTPPPKPEAPPEETPCPTEKGSAALDELFRTPPPKPEPPVEETPRPTEKSTALDELFRTPTVETPVPPEESPAGEQEYTDAFESEQARRAEEREQAAEARRAAFFEKYSASTPDQEEQLKRRWARIEAAQTMAEVLVDSGAPLDQWMEYLHSSVFLIVKGDPEFVAGFEDLLRDAAGLPDHVKWELLRAFSGMDARQVPQVWHGIHQILAGRTPQADQPGKSPDVVPVWKTGTFRFCLIFFLVTLFAAAAVLLGPMVLVRALYLLNFPARKEQAQLCQYLEEDTGRKVEGLWEGGFNYKDIYCLWDQPSITFKAQAEGERDLAAGELGYTTNFSNIMLTDALEKFAEEQDCELWLIDGEDYRSSWMFGSSVPESYCIEVPMWEGEELLTALNSLMAELEQESWYQLLPLEYFEFDFVYSGFDHVIWYTYTSDEPFDGQALLDNYRSGAGESVCSYLVEQSGLLEADFGGAEYRLEPQEVVELPNFFGRTDRFARVDGVLAETGETVRVYLYSNRALYSLLPEELESAETADDLRGDYFQSTGDADLFRGLSIWRQSREN